MDSLASLALATELPKPFLFAGEYMIPESVPKYMNPNKPGFVMAGRADDWNGKPLYTRDMMN